jgi:threonyl-tRNA synthetase
MLIIGDKEMESGQVSLRLRSEENPGAMPLEDFLTLAQKDIAEKA